MQKLNIIYCNLYILLYILYFSLFTLYSTLYIPQFAIYILLSTFNIAQSRFQSLLVYILNTTFFIISFYVLYSALYTPHCTYPTLDILHFTLYTPDFTLHTLHFPLHTPHSTWWRGAWWRRPLFCVVGIALRDIDLHFTW
jgi:hypothetical protein